MNDVRDRWLAPGWRPAPTARFRLFCLPHAGGGASVYRPFAPAFAPDIDVCPIQLPGRENRLRDPPVVDLDAIADAVWRHSELPYAVFGHSMGAAIAFEILPLLRMRGAPQPTGLIVSAAHPPDAPDPFAARMAYLSDADLVAELVALDGLPTDLRDNTEFVSLLLPAVRADLIWCAEDHPEVADPVATPILAVCGTQDPIVAPAAMRGWARASAGGFRLHVLPGGHFAPHHDVRALAALIRDEVFAARP